MNHKTLVRIWIVLLVLVWSVIVTASGQPIASANPARNPSARSGRIAATIAPKTPLTISLFGDGRDGDLVLLSGQVVTVNTTRVSVTAAGDSAAPANSNGFKCG